MKNELEDFIQHNRDKFDNKTPDPAVLGRILQQMQLEEKPAPKGILIPFRVIQWAAAAVILIAVGIAFWALHKRPEIVPIVKTKVNTEPIKKPVDQNIKQQEPAPEMTQTESSKRKSIDDVDRDIAARKRVLFARLKAEGSHSDKLVLFAGLNNMESAATRIAAINSTYKLKDAGNDIVNALVEKLNTDPNTNVRLAALDGLSRFYQESYVRKKLIASLKKQQDPFVQIALINLLTRMKESGILSELNQIIKDGNTDESVKGTAYSGILQLQSS